MPCATRSSTQNQTPRITAQPGVSRHTSPATRLETSTAIPTIRWSVSIVRGSKAESISASEGRVFPLRMAEDHLCSNTVHEVGYKQAASAAELHPCSRLRRPRRDRRIGLLGAQPHRRPEAAATAGPRRPSRTRAGCEERSRGRSASGIASTWVAMAVHPVRHRGRVPLPVGVILKAADSVFVLVELVVFIVLLLVALILRLAQGRPSIGR